MAFAFADESSSVNGGYFLEQATTVVTKRGHYGPCIFEPVVEVASRPIIVNADGKNLHPRLRPFLSWDRKRLPLPYGLPPPPGPTPTAVKLFWPDSSRTSKSKTVSGASAFIRSGGTNLPLWYSRTSEYGFPRVVRILQPNSHP